MHLKKKSDHFSCHQPGEVFYTADCDLKCTCNPPSVDCDSGECPPSQQCGVQGGILGCHPISTYRLLFKHSFCRNNSKGIFQGSLKVLSTAVGCWSLVFFSILKVQFATLTLTVNPKFLYGLCHWNRLHPQPPPPVLPLVIPTTPLLMSWSTTSWAPALTWCPNLATPPACHITRSTRPTRTETTTTE